MMLSKDYKRILLTAIIPIVFWNFYWYVGFNSNITKLIVFIFGLFFTMKYSPEILRGLRIKQNNQPFIKHISLFLLVVLISIFNAYVYWDQSPDLTFRSGVSIFVFVSYYYFQKNNLQKNVLETTIFILAGIYLVLWLYALSQAPTVVFGNLEAVQDDRGYYRILQLAGLDTVVFLYFYSITHISMLTGWKKILSGLTIAVCAVAIFLTLTRIVIIAVFALTILFIVRKKSIWVILTTLVIAFIGSHYIFSSEIVDSLFNLTNESSMSDLRAPEYQMAFELYPFHIGTFLFGNGSEHIASAYGQMEAHLKSAYAFNRSDAGFIGVYVTYGVIGLVLLLSILLQVMRYRVSDDNYYLKLVVYFIFFVNITAYHFSDYGFTLMASLYLLSINNKKHV